MKFNFFAELASLAVIISNTLLPKIVYIQYIFFSNKRIFVLTLCPDGKELC